MALMALLLITRQYLQHQARCFRMVKCLDTAAGAKYFAPVDACINGDKSVALMKHVVIREQCLTSSGLFVSLTLRAALRAFKALHALVGSAGLHPGHAGCLNDMCRLTSRHYAKPHGYPCSVLQSTQYSSREYMQAERYLDSFPRQ
jgi:hypothetical protein